MASTRSCAPGSSYRTRTKIGGSALICATLECSALRHSWMPVSNSHWRTVDERLPAYHYNIQYCFGSSFKPTHAALYPPHGFVLLPQTGVVEKLVLHEVGPQVEARDRAMNPLMRTLYSTKYGAGSPAFRRCCRICCC